MFDTFKNFLKIIAPRKEIGGLQISDSALQYVVLVDGVPTSYGVRLAPGILVGGKIIDSKRFEDSLRELHNLINLAKPKTAFRVIACLPADLVYTQSFTVPNLEEEKNKESISLNLQMLSPVAAEGAYMSSQTLESAEDHIEILGAFAEKNRIEEFRKALYATHFVPVAFEFPALALSRLLKHTIGAQKEVTLLLQISSEGIDFLIYKNQSLYFDYFRSWRSIQGGESEISRTVFESVLSLEAQKVINFSLSRFKEAPKKIFIIATGYEDIVKEILEGAFHVPVSPLVASEYALGSSWYAVLGSALRGEARGQDQEVTLGAESVLHLLYEDRVLGLFRTSRSVAFGVVISFIIMFMISLSFLNAQSKLLEEKLKTIPPRSVQGELAVLASYAQEFNGLVRAVSAIKTSEKPWLTLFEELKKITDSNQIVIDRIDGSSFSGPITLGAHGPDHASVLRFKNVLGADPRFSNVDLPLSRITVGADNAVNFTLTFQAKQFNTPR